MSIFKHLESRKNLGWKMYYLNFVYALKNVLKHVLKCEN